MLQWEPMLTNSRKLRSLLVVQKRLNTTSYCGQLVTCYNRMNKVNRYIQTLSAASQVSGVCVFGRIIQQSELRKRCKMNGENSYLRAFEKKVITYLGKNYLSDT